MRSKRKCHSTRENVRRHHKCFRRKLLPAAPKPLPRTRGRSNQPPRESQKLAVWAALGLRGPEWRSPPKYSPAWGRPCEVALHICPFRYARPIPAKHQTSAADVSSARRESLTLARKTCPRSTDNFRKPDTLWRFRTQAFPRIGVLDKPEFHLSRSPYPSARYSRNRSRAASAEFPAPPCGQVRARRAMLPRQFPDTCWSARCNGLPVAPPSTHRLL